MDMSNPCLTHCLGILALANICSCASHLKSASYPNLSRPPSPHNEITLFCFFFFPVILFLTCTVFSTNFIYIHTYLYIIWINLEPIFLLCVGNIIWKLYPRTQNQCEKCTQCKEFFVFILWRTLEGIQFMTPRTLLTTPGPYCLIFPNFPRKQVYLVCLTCQTAQTSPWAGRWAATLILQVLTIWNNSASQVVIRLFLLSFGSWNFPQQRTVEPLWETLPLPYASFSRCFVPTRPDHFSDSTT